MVSFGGCGVVAFRRGGGHQRSDRTCRLAFGCLPVQAVAAARVADDFHRINPCLIAVTAFGRIFLLRRHEAMGGTDRAELVFADPAVDQLLGARFGIEIPFAALAGQWDRQRPIVDADIENSQLAFCDDGVLVSVGFQEILAVGGIGDGIARTQEPVAFRSEYRHQRLFVFALEGGDEGIDRSFRRGEQPRLRNVRRILLVAGGQQAGKSRQ